MFSQIELQSCETYRAAKNSQSCINYTNMIRFEYRPFARGKRFHTNNIDFVRLNPFLSCVRGPGDGGAPVSVQTSLLKSNFQLPEVVKLTLSSQNLKVGSSTSRNSGLDVGSRSSASGSWKMEVEVQLPEVGSWKLKVERSGSVDTWKSETRGNHSSSGTIAGWFIALGWRRDQKHVGIATRQII